MSLEDCARALAETNAALVKEQERITAALQVAYQHGCNDGCHHKAWVIDHMVRALTGDGYAAWVAEAKRDGEDPDAYDWEEGIAP